MSISTRQKQILELLEATDHLSVKELSKLTYTSESSVRRDLTRLENLSLLKRTHGGACAINELSGAVPLRSRMTQSVAEKRKIARVASSFLKDGQSVMLDGSSTAGYLVPYIAKHKNITLFTNNMITAIKKGGFING